jgi:hypothetical protein
VQGAHFEFEVENRGHLRIGVGRIWTIVVVTGFCKEKVGLP